MQKQMMYANIGQTNCSLSETERVYSVDSTQNFSGLAQQYELGRPAYAEKFIDTLYSKYGFGQESVIADIGSGTGKLAKQLLDRGSFVYCVEPNADMRNAAADILEGYEKLRIVDGAVAETGLDRQSVDFVTTAQAFHWFDPELFKRECRRILRREGTVFLIWNIRDRSDEINQLSFEIYSEFCPDFKGFGGGIQKDDKRIQQFFDSRYEYLEFPHPLFYNRAQFISRSLSGSYSLKPGDKRYEEYIEALASLYDKYEKDHILEIANKTVVYIGTVSQIRENES